MVAQSATDKVNHAVARNSKVNQMCVTTNAGDVKYYNTAELASVKFEGIRQSSLPMMVAIMMNMMLLSEKSTLPRKWSRVKMEA